MDVTVASLAAVSAFYIYSIAQKENYVEKPLKNHSTNRMHLLPSCLWHVAQPAERSP